MNEAQQNTSKLLIQLEKFDQDIKMVIIFYLISLSFLVTVAFSVLFVFHAFRFEYIEITGILNLKNLLIHQ